MVFLEEQQLFVAVWASSPMLDAAWDAGDGLLSSSLIALVPPPQQLPWVVPPLEIFDAWCAGELCPLVTGAAELGCIIAWGNIGYIMG